MAMSARHLHRKNVRNQQQRHASSSESFREDGMPTNKNTADAHSPDEDIDVTPEKNSKIAKFLFDGDEDTTSNDDMPSIRDSDALWLALVMQPLNIRNELIIQLFEALAIFAALFLNGVWILYEWGSSRGYGDYDSNTTANRIFDLVISIALVLCIFLALNSAMAWIISILYSSSNENFVYNTKRSIAYLYGVLNAIVQLVGVGILLGIYINLSPYWPETIISLIIAVGMYTMGAIVTRWLVINCIPLEYYHLPRWMKVVTPVMWTTPKQRAKVKKDAKTGLKCSRRYQNASSIANRQEQRK